MVEHVRVLAIIGILRAVLGTALGVYLLAKGSGLSFTDYGRAVAEESTVRLDRVALCGFGSICLCLAPVRAVQGILALRRKRKGRVLGTWLAVWDLANLLIFPISTALGLWAFVVYRHADVRSHFGSAQR